MPPNPKREITCMPSPPEDVVQTVAEELIFKKI